MQPVNSLIVYDVNQAVQQVKQASEILRVLRSDVLRQGIDYGVIPGTGNKPTLLKPGAERLCSAFGLSPEFELVSKVEEWNPERPLFNYQYRCRLVHIESGKTVATGIGSCNSMESKYRWRNAERVCPNCGKPAIIKGKAEYGGGWVCFDKKGGCKSKFTDDDKRITDQQGGKVENKDIFDQVNTLDKMAQKRSLIAATLIGCNASEHYTQDIEDLKSFEDVIDGEIIDDQPASQPSAAEPPKPPKSNGNGHQAWYSVGDNMATVNKWLKQHELTLEQGNKLAGKSHQEFATGKEYLDSILTALKQPAQPKNGTPKEEQPPASWFESKKEYEELTAYLNRWEMTPIIGLQKLGVDTWRVFVSLDEAKQAIRKTAFEQCWPMKAFAARYEPMPAGNSRITFDTVIPVTWFAGRAQLSEAVSEAQNNWQEVQAWEKEATYTLPEPIRIEVKQNGEHLEITHIVSATAIPF